MWMTAKKSNEPKTDKPVRIADQTGYDPKSISDHAAGMFAADEIDVRGKTVFLLFCADHSFGSVVAGVHPAFVLGVAEAIARLGAATVFIRDPTPYGLLSPLSALADAYKSRLSKVAKVVHLNDSPRVTVKISAPLVQHEFKVPAVVFGCDLLMVAPKAKTDLFSGVCTSAVTMLQMEADDEKHIFRDYRFHQKTADIYYVRRPDYVIYDAIVCGEGQGPNYATSRSLGLMIGGKTAVNVDVIAARLMGFMPGEIDHLRLLADKRAGTTNFRTIEVDPLDFLSKAEKLKRAEWNVEGLDENIKVIGGSRFFCASGCVGFTRQALEPWLASENIEISKPLHLIIGGPVEGFKETVDRNRTLVIGDCAACHAGLGKYVPGCPPRPESIELALMEIMGVRAARRLRLRFARLLGAPERWKLEFVRSHLFSDTALIEFSIPSIFGYAARGLLKKSALWLYVKAIQIMRLKKMRL